MTRRVLVPVLVTLLAVSAIAAAPDPGPVAVATPKATAPSSPGLPTLEFQPYQQEVAGIVAEFLERAHYEQVSIDDELSSKWLDRYLDDLDPARIVFLQSDIQEFEKYRHELDDDLLARPLARLDPALVIYNRYRQRMVERAADAKAIAAGPVDLTNPERMVTDRKKAGLGWPATAAEARDLWRQRVEAEYISALLPATDRQASQETPTDPQASQATPTDPQASQATPGHDTEDEVRDRLVKRYDRYAKNIAEMEPPDVLETYLDALTTSVDPHSVWWQPISSDDFDVDITNSVEGIGAQLTTEEGLVTVDAIVPGGPAAENGKIRAKDHILAVAQKGQEPVDVVEMRLDKVVSMIRGPKGTEVDLTIEHADTGEREVVSLIRDRVILERSTAEGRVETLDGHKYGYLRLSNFYVDGDGSTGGRTASNDLRKRIDEVKAQGVEGMILDLRGNGGGSLNEAVQVAGLFLPGGPVVQVRDRRGSIEALHDADPSMEWDGPLEVLVDATSASASEIVAGALQDYGRAVIVGDHNTHGKGTVQQVVELTPQLRGRPKDGIGGSLKLTIQKFYRVSGGSTQNLGVISDVPLPSVWDGVEYVHESDLPNAMAWDRIPPAPYTRTADLASVLPKLASASKARVAASQDYSALGQLLAKNEQDEASNDVSLVLAERQKDYADRKALSVAAGGDPDEDASDAKLTDEQKKAEARKADYELDEGLAVLRDLVAATGPAPTSPGTPGK